MPMTKRGPWLAAGLEGVEMSSFGRGLVLEMDCGGGGGSGSSEVQAQAAPVSRVTELASHTLQRLQYVPLPPSLPPHRLLPAGDAKRASMPQVGAWYFRRQHAGPTTLAPLDLQVLPSRC
ncbi:hypothetical protein G7Z17_g13507 [Cylindrodendrum hubeiense]|uniref:Uncharacterized protein n=1 Tax=Cylindrodendrum hubeiense TaxID=595255 RepID=A0A9P5L866_9HYPO|nr:hypothetical protein G7Z17_g13507 [Cylindrodendrum hubeiense]